MLWHLHGNESKNGLTHLTTQHTITLTYINHTSKNLNSQLFVVLYVVFDIIDTGMFST